MKEKDMQVIFRNILTDNPPNKTAVYELKLCKSRALPFNAVKVHQVEGLLNAKLGNLFHKISDSPIFAGAKSRFTKPKPFDCFSLYHAGAYIVILYYKPRQPKEFILIDIEAYIQEAERSTRKRLTEERAREIAEEIIK